MMSSADPMSDHSIMYRECTGKLTDYDKLSNEARYTYPVPQIKKSQ